MRFILILLFSTISLAQDIGLPFVEDFSTSIQTRRETRDLVQGRDGILYFTNRLGVLRFNGNSWSTIPITNFGIAQSLHISNDNILYIGGRSDFGYIDLNAKKLVYTSLTHLLPDSLQGFGNVWYVRENKNGIYYQSDHYIFRYVKHEKSVQFIHSKQRFHTLHESNGKIITRSLKDGGLVEIDGSSPKLLPKGEFFEYGNSPFILIGLPDDRQLYGTRKHGLFYFKNGRKTLFTSPELNKEILKSVLYRGIHLKHRNRIAIATLTNGIYILNSDGTLYLHLTDENGLSDSDVKHLLEDRNGNLWAALNSGINRIELNSPYRVFDKRHGFKFTVHHMYSSKGRTFFTTNNGLWTWNDFNLSRIGTQTEIFHEVLEVGEKLLASSEFGVYEINDHSLTRFYNEICYDLATTSRANRVLTATQTGLYTADLKNGKLELLQKVKDSRGNIYNILKTSDREFWYTDATGELYQLQFDEQIETYTKTKHAFQSLAKTQRAKLVIFDDIIYTLIEDTVRQFNPSFNSFSVVESPVIPLTKFQWVVPANDSLSVALNNGLDGITNIYHNGTVSNFTHRRLEPLYPAKQIFPASSGVWTALYNSLVFYNTSWNDLDRFNFESNISTITLGEDSVLNNALVYSDTLASPIPFSHNRVRFQVNSNAYVADNFTQFRFRLHGLNETWSPWQRNSLKEYTNLSEGKYTFEVEAKSVYDITGTAATFQFEILPPWKRSFIGIALYILLGLGAILILVKLRTRSLKKRNESLERLVQSRTEQLEHQTEKLREADQLKTQFFTNISHEIRTPLTLLLSPFDGLERQQLPEKAKKTLALMRSNGQRLLTLINQLLDFSKLEHGKLPVKAAAVDLVELIKRVVASFQNERSVRFAHHVATFQVEFDSEKLQKILYNLISNAVKFSENGMPVDVLLSVNTNTFSIKVKDRGIGVADELKEKIFERFYQVDQRREREYEGSGIGLALTKELVGLLGGSIELESAKDFGSTFTLTFPFTKVESAAAVSAEPKLAEAEQNGQTAPLELPITQKKFNILVAEDNDDLRNFIAELFEENYNVTSVPDGHAALGAVKKRMPDIIISDVMMPRLDGFELLKQLKENEVTSHVPILMLTAKAAETAKLEGLESGANDYLTKPFSAEELRLRVRNQLALVEAIHRQYDETIHNDVALNKASFEHPFVTHAAETVLKFIDDPDFDVEKFCYEIGVSRSNLHRKLKSLTGQSTTDFIRQIRLKKAKELLLGYNETVSSVAIQVGFNSLSYFNRQFKRLYNINPSDYRKRHHHL